MPPFAHPTLDTSFEDPMTVGLRRRGASTTTTNKTMYAPPATDHASLSFLEGGQAMNHTAFQQPLSPDLFCTVIITTPTTDPKSNHEGEPPQTTPPPPPPPPRQSIYRNAPQRNQQQQQQQQLSPIPRGWKGQLLKASNIASLLCVLDCTILPFLTIILPFFGCVVASPAQMDYFHELGHQLALYCVLPVGFLATTLNYILNHQQGRILAVGYAGLLAVFVSNAGCHWVHKYFPHDRVHHDTHDHYFASLVSDALHQVSHAVHEGIAHRVTNILGCGLLLTSNWLSHRAGGCQDPTCMVIHNNDRTK